MKVTRPTREQLDVWRKDYLDHYSDRLRTDELPTFAEYLAPIVWNAALERAATLCIHRGAVASARAIRHEKV